jgi:hypothetical protein
MPLRMWEAGSFTTRRPPGLSIIKSNTIWMRNTNCMADYSEVQHGWRKLTSDKKLLQPLVELLDKELAGAGQEAIKLFDQWWNDTQFQTFITSISEHDAKEDGRLSMWRAFGGQQARVALVIKMPLEDINAGDALKIWLSPVAYFSDAEFCEELDNLLRNVALNLDQLKQVSRPILISSLFIMLVSMVVCLKHEGFDEEREWRIVYSPKRLPSDLMLSSIETINGVPQPIYKIPIGGGPPAALDPIGLEHLLDRIIIGPTPFPWAVYQAFAAALNDAGVTNAENKVFVSGIPLRS